MMMRYRSPGPFPRPFSRRKASALITAYDALSEAKTADMEKSSTVADVECRYITKNYKSISNLFLHARLRNRGDIKSMQAICNR